MKLPNIQKCVNDGDLLVPTADHRNDSREQSTDHTWEYVPLLCASIFRKNNAHVGMHCSFADIGRIAAEFFAVSGVQS